ncbi:hypothetical protein BdWA1_002411 [Babesia duncani]|uniref:Uncharacterized protein n=1 Tax=Babesia duncani TaxID=323732 RepID=A0AAD9PJN7_9APIC|nr:hypothetical protein BdWA1_002411 [Babesia duncani]
MDISKDEAITIDFTFNREPVGYEEEYKPLQIVKSVAKVKKAPKERSHSSTGFERAKTYEISKKDSNDYKRINLMYRMYRICENFNFPNNEKIYNLYLKRLVKRARLESCDENLQVVVAALYYIDRMDPTLSLRDILGKIPLGNIQIKHFAKVIAKLSDELAIEKLPVVSYRNLITQCLNQIRSFCSDACIDHVPKSTSMVLSKLTKIQDLGDYLSDPFLYDENINGQQKAKMRLFSKRRMTYKALVSKFDTIEGYSQMLCEHLEHIGAIPAVGNVLEGDSRRLMACNKTIAAAILYIVMVTLKTCISGGIVVEALNLPRSSFYRNCNQISQKLLKTLNLNSTATIEANCMQHPQLLLVVLKQIAKDPASFNSSKRIASDAIKRKFASTVRKLEKPPSDCTNVSIIDEKSRNRILVKFKDKMGNVRRKCFSKTKYGPEGALDMASAFLHANPSPQSLIPLA